MKKFIGKLAIGLACFTALFCLSGCSKTEENAYYKYFGLEDMYYLEDQYSTAVAFFSDLGSIMTKYDGTYINENSMISDINKVVSKYNYGAVSGTFYLKKSTKSKEGPWSTVKSWGMKFSSKYTKSADTAERSMSDIVK